MLRSLDALPGYSNEAFDELKSHSEDDNYTNGCLVVDGMSIKELVEFDQGLGRPFGYIDYGGLQDLGETDSKAKEALVVMLVGLRKFWKPPLGYFLVKGTPGGLVAGIIRESLLLSFQAGVKVWTCTMDGTQHNLTAFTALGAVLQTQSVDD